MASKAQVSTRSTFSAMVAQSGRAGVNSMRTPFFCFKGRCHENPLAEKQRYSLNGSCGILIRKSGPATTSLMAGPMMTKSVEMAAKMPSQAMHSRGGENSKK
jgi:hypothetical protein